MVRKPLIWLGLELAGVLIVLGTIFSWALSLLMVALFVYLLT